MTTLTDTAKVPNATVHRDPDQRFALRPVHALIVVLFGLGLFVPTAGPEVSLTRHEVLAAQPAREMLQYGHWIIPTFAGKPRLVKPPTTGWAIALFMKLTGSQSEIVVRLPSAISATAIGLIVALLTARYGGSTLGLIAGLTQFTFYYVLMQGRLAEADMPMAACVAAALYNFAIATVPGPRAPSPTLGRHLLFHVFAALAFCFKGPVGMAFVYPACFLYLILMRERRYWWFVLGPPGILVFLVIAAAWPELAYHEYPAITAVWRNETFGRVVGDLAGEEYHAWWFYGPATIMLLVPWVPWTIGGLIATIGSGRWRTPIAKFLFAWFVPGFIILSMVAWKHKHYLIPIMPALTIPTAWALFWWFRELRRGKTLSRGTSAMLFVSGCASSALLVNRYVSAGRAQIIMFIAVLALGGLIVLWTSAKRSAPGQLAAFFATSFVLCFGAQVLVMPYYDVYRDWTELGHRVAAQVPPGQTTYLIGLYEAQPAFYMNFPMQRCDTEAEVRATFGAMHDSAYAVVPVSMIPILQQLGDVEAIDRSPTKLRLVDKDQQAVWLVYFTPVRSGVALAR